MCKVEKVGKEPLNDLQSIVEKKKLEWKDVAFMGKTTVFLFVNILIGRNWKHVEATALKSSVFNIYVKVFCCLIQIWIVSGNKLTIKDVWLFVFVQPISAACLSKLL